LESFRSHGIDVGLKWRISKVRQDLHVSVATYCLAGESGQLERVVFTWYMQHGHYLFLVRLHADTGVQSRLSDIVESHTQIDPILVIRDSAVGSIQCGPDDIP
jgi:hypothetical protein